MGERQDFSDIGQRIKDALQDAVASGDFGQMNEVVNDTVGSAIDEVRRQTSQIHERIFRTDFPEDGVPKKKKKRLSAYIDRKGSISGILCMVFGAVGLGAFGITAFLLLIYWLMTWNKTGFYVLLLFAVPAAVSGGFLKKGCGLRTRLKDAERYLKLAGEQMYMKIEDLAARTGKSSLRVRRDIRRMLEAGIFPEGHMDPKETMFVLDDETWERYLTALKEWEERCRLEKTAQKKVEASQQNTETQIEKEVREYMERLRDLNAEIPGETVSNKLYRLDYLLQRILMVLKDHPEKCSQMQKFMDYYLPTTVKLVESYADFDRAGIQGNNIAAAKTEIERTMDTINQAFEKLLDDMYQNAAFEAAADAKVLKTILKQDGYTKSEFSVGSEEEGDE